jgi:hypothetical protein
MLTVLEIGLCHRELRYVELISMDSEHVRFDVPMCVVCNFVQLFYDIYHLQSHVLDPSIAFNSWWNLVDVIFKGDWQVCGYQELPALGHGVLNVLRGKFKLCRLLVPV